MKIPLAILLLVPLAAADPLDLRMAPRATCDPVTLTDESGTFSTPHHPDNYPSNVDCTWLIFAPTDRVVRLTFTEFDTEAPRDVVKVFDGPSAASALLLEHSGNGLPESNLLVSSTNAMFVLFSSDVLVQRSGFKAEYAATLPPSNETTTPAPATLPPDVTCGGAAVGSGVLLSPNYPNPYDPDSNCTWFLQGKSELVTLNITHLVTEVKVDYLQVWDGWDTTVASLTKLSGDLSADVPMSITSPTGNRLTVRFVTDDTVEESGFVAFFS